MSFSNKDTMMPFSADQMSNLSRGAAIREGSNRVMVNNPIYSFTWKESSQNYLMGGGVQGKPRGAVWWEIPTITTPWDPLIHWGYAQSVKGRHPEWDGAMGTPNGSIQPAGRSKTPLVRGGVGGRSFALTLGEFSPLGQTELPENGSILIKTVDNPGSLEHCWMLKRTKASIRRGRTIIDDMLGLVTCIWMAC